LLVLNAQRKGRLLKSSLARFVVYYRTLHIFSETFFSQRCRLLIIPPYHHQYTSWWVHYRLFSRAYPPSVVT